ncbi:protease subunit of ATP-dependent Clp protease [Lactiplantibacillus xiangfangensis]|uniref:ATP-dependent Clp protease proteolytic subunit n=1 Tax=Lactiplantibacillus xiangfangensis TaxID=942150 RepID=A0A0R2MU90_9LACO|nr:protease subunit of ATP-dependent Clp protease [Lactiplantibacillus xiangfangensis]
MITNNDDAPIYRDWLGMNVIAPNDVIDALPNDNSPVTLEIASNGGEVDPATEIYTVLHNYNGQVTASIISNAYSAGTIIAMGADKVQMSPGAKMMIHNASSGTEGNYHDMDKASGMLKATNQAIANMYAEKTGKPIQDFLDLMDQETWLTADDAIKLGLADEKLDFSPEPITNAVGKLMPRQVMAKIHDLLNENQKLKQSSQMNRQPSEHQKLVDAKLAIFYGEDE